MVTKTTGKIIIQGKNCSLEEASADDPIYTQGFVVGARNLKNSSKTTQAKTSSSEEQAKPQDVEKDSSEDNK